MNRPMLVQIKVNDVLCNSWKLATLPNRACFLQESKYLPISNAVNLAVQSVMKNATRTLSLNVSVSVKKITATSKLILDICGIVTQITSSAHSKDGRTTLPRRRSVELTFFTSTATVTR